MLVLRRRRAPVFVDGEGEGALKGEGERERVEKSTPRLRGTAD